MLFIYLCFVGLYFFVLSGMTERSFDVNPNALDFAPPAIPSQELGKESLLIKRKRTDRPLNELVVEHQRKKQKFVTIEDAFGTLSMLGKRKLYRLEDTIPFTNTNGIMVVEPDRKRMKRDLDSPLHKVTETKEKDFVVDVYVLDTSAKEEEIETHEPIYFMESYIASNGEGKEYDSDYDSEDSNAEQYFANSYPEDLSSFDEDLTSGDEGDNAYFSDYDDYE